MPRLRFAEFRGAGEWVAKSLEEVAPLQRGFDLPSDRINPGNVPIVYSNGVNGFHDKGMASAPGLVTGRSGTIGKLHFIEEGDYWPHNTSLWVTSFESNYPKFIYYLYTSIGVGRFTSGSGVPTLNRNDVHAFKTLIPQSIAEQQKIADCLTSLDDRIRLETERLNALKDHKKGLMQQMFPAEGETVPRLRFAEFREAGEWSKTEIGQIADVYRGKGIAKSDIAHGGKQLCIRYGELYTIYGEVIHDVLSATNVPTQELFLSKANDVIIPASGETKEDIATASCVMRDGIALGGDLNVIRSPLNGVFLSYYMNGALSNNIARVAQGDSVVHLYPSQLKLLEISFPLRHEQQKIADCLSSLDDRIRLETKRLNALKDHKKGLMQQLFPALHDMAI